jgi:beta-lactamase regulating signal transducer with metallopeptidase domain
MTPFLQSVGWTVMHFVWQGAALASIAAVALRLTTRRSANVRYLIGCGALLLMLAAPAATLRLSWPADAGAIARVAYEAAGAQSAGRLNALDPAAAVHPYSASVPDAVPTGIIDLAQLDRIALGIALVWVAGVAILLGRMAGGWWRVRRLHRAALATPSSRWQTACRRLAYRLGLPAAAHVVESALVEVPTVVGCLRPAILLPVAALAALTPAQMEAILAHELAHIRRHDYAVNVLQTIAETLLFYHPAVWWLSSRIRAEREHCCDEIAVSVCGDPVGYAQALAELESRRTVATTMAMAATGGSLIERVRRILQLPLSDEPRSQSWAVTLGLTLLFTAGAGGLQHLPWASPRADARGVTATARHGVAISQAGPRLTLERAELPPSPDPATTPAIAQTAQPPQPPQPEQPPQLPQPEQPPQPPQPEQPPQPAQLPRPPNPPADDADVWDVPPVPPIPPLPLVPPFPHVGSVAPAPPIPSVPPVPPVPPAPPGPPGDALSVQADHGQWRMRFSDDGVRLDVALSGTIAFTDDLTDVAALSDGGTFRMRDWSRGVPRTVEIKAAGGKLTRAYYVAGLSRPWDDDARAFLKTQLPIFVRRSGIGAEARVKSIFEKKGVNGVLEEIDLLGSDYARRLYLVALVDRAPFNSSSIGPVLARVHERMTSDYDQRLVLTHVASHVALDAAGASSYIKAMSSMRSDYDQRLALTALTKASGAHVTGDAMVSAVDHIKSSYDKRLVLADVIDRGAISADSKRSVLTAAAAMQSDYDRGQVLTSYVDSYGVEPGLREPFFAAVRAIKSDYERRRVLTRVANKGRAAPEVQQSAFDVVSQMSSDYDRAEILLAFVSSQGVDSSIRPAFVSAAERLKSQYDQNRVLAALIRAESR